MNEYFIVITVAYNVHRLLDRCAKTPTLLINCIVNDALDHAVPTSSSKLCTRD